MKNQKGFTLVELIVVIVIIGILAAVAVPRLMNLTGSAQITACKQNVMNLTSEIQAGYAAAIATAGGGSMQSWYGAGAGATIQARYTCPDAAGGGDYSALSWSATGDFFSASCALAAHN